MGDQEVFSCVSSKKSGKFIDGYQYYRLAKHDTTQRFQPSEVDENSIFYISVHGFKGCPFCLRAIEAVLALEEEFGSDVIVVDAFEHENRVDYSKWLSSKRNELSKNYKKVAYHTSSPIV